MAWDMALWLLLDGVGCPGAILPARHLLFAMAYLATGIESTWSSGKRPLGNPIGPCSWTMASGAARFIRSAQMKMKIAKVTDKAATTAPGDVGFEEWGLGGAPAMNE